MLHTFHESPRSKSHLYCSVPRCGGTPVPDCRETLCRDCWTVVERMLKGKDTTREQLQEAGIFQPPDSEDLILRTLEKVLKR